MSYSSLCNGDNALGRLDLVALQDKARRFNRLPFVGLSRALDELRQAFLASGVTQDSQYRLVLRRHASSRPAHTTTPP